MCTNNERRTSITIGSKPSRTLLSGCSPRCLYDGEGDGGEPLSCSLRGCALRNPRYMLTCAIPMTSYVMVAHLRYMPCCRKSTLLCVRAPKTHTLRKKSTDERSRWQSGSAARCERRRQSTLHQHASKLCDGSTQTILHPTMVRICFYLSHRWYRDFFSCVLGAC